MSSKNAVSHGSQKQSPFEEQRLKIEHVRALLGPLPGKLALYCSDACIKRYLIARNWNVKKATKMLKGSLNWRLAYKPEEIRWEEIAQEAETGKIYRSNFVDKLGRSVLVMRPGCQNTNSSQGQIRYLVYCMENAILNLPADQEQLVWLIDFRGFKMSHVSVKVTKESVHVLQNRYPERLGLALLYNPPKIFEPIFQVVKPFVEPKTLRKFKFVYADDPNSLKIMEELFNEEELETAFGGNNQVSFNISDYAAKMREDDKRMPLYWAGVNASELLVVPTLDVNTESDSNKPAKEDEEKSSPLPDNLEELNINGTKGNDDSRLVNE